MADSSSELVECPLCETTFNPAVAGGWCTNTDCGEWQYDGAVGDSDETTDEDSAATADESADGDGLADSADATDSGESSTTENGEAEVEQLMAELAEESEAANAADGATDEDDSSAEAE